MAFPNDFIQEFFIRPIVDSSVPGYNPVNTLVYGLILLGVAFYVIYPYLTKRGVVFNWDFMRMLIPYILFGISLRVLEDQDIIQRSVNPLDAGFYVFTPGIWILTFVLVVLGMGLGKLLSTPLHRNATTITFAFGLLVALPVFLFNLMRGMEWGAFLGILALVAIVSGILFYMAKRLKWEFLDDNLAKLAVSGQILDAGATFVALEFFQCAEQHVLPRLLFGAFGNISFFFIKIPLILFIVYFLHKEFTKDNDPNMRGYVLIFLAILGLATGGRNLLTILAGTCS